MAQLRHLLSNERDVWKLKDTLQLLDKDPASMYRAEFVRYMEAKAEQLAIENMSNGMSLEEAIKAAQVALNDDVRVWKAAAARKRARQ